MAFCTQCGEALVAVAKFCGECGARVVGKATPPAAAAAPVEEATIARSETVEATVDAAAQKPASTNPFLHDQRSAEGIRREMGVEVEAPAPAVPAQPPDRDPLSAQAIAPGGALTCDEARRIFVGKAYDYYEKQWQSYLKSNEQTFNWWALLGGPIWALYRKMYKSGAIVLGVCLAYGAISTFIESEVQQSLRPLDAVFQLGVGLYMGFTGNEKYRRFTDLRIGTLIKTHRPEELESALREAGGVNWVVPLSIVMFFMLLGFLGALAQ